VSRESLLQSLNRIDAVMQQSARLQRVSNYVWSRYCEPLHFDDVAAVAAFERMYFCRFIHRKIGVSFSAWLRMIRVAQAIHLLRTTAMSVAEIALAVGFSDSGGLQRSCRRLINQSPREIREDNPSRDGRSEFK
jgi:transcriptional regulator GlxA family with amidase domain